MPFEDYKTGSKKNWGENLADNAQFTTDKIQLGAILRIADSVEAMAKNINILELERNNYRDRYNERVERVSLLNKRISAYKGQITKLKKQLNALTDQKNNNA